MSESVATSPQPSIAKERVVWIDTAKGVCISLVVLSHVAIYLSRDYGLASLFRTFRMPLYYILSGLFFKPYEGWRTFFKKKTNNLIIPYLFFFLMTSVLLPVVLSATTNFKSYGLEAVKYIFSEYPVFNTSIWFLVSLFEVNCYFYLLYLLTKKTSKPVLWLALTTLIGGVIGMHVNWPCYLDTSLSMLPFFFFGWWLNHHSDYMQMSFSGWKRTVSVLALSVAVLVFIYFLNGGNAEFRLNRYGNWLGKLQLYPYGILGTLAVLSLSKLVGQVPLLSYVGRYSIIVLCTHSLVILLIGSIWKQFQPVEATPFWLFFLLTILVNWAVIPLFVRFFPHVTAQKPLIK